MADDDDTDIPETGAVFTFGKSKFAENVPNKFYIRNDRVTQVACGDEHTALVAESGRVFTFGANDWGQLGLGHTNPTYKPMCIKSMKHEKVRYAACGRSHTLLATESGRLYSFGANSENQLGIDDQPGCNVPKHIDTQTDWTYRMLAAGADHSIALTDEGKVYVWGSGSEGQLGLGDETESAAPTLLSFHKTIKTIACGYYHTAFVTDDGELYTCGEFESGKLGLGDDLDETDTPQFVNVPGKVVWVSCGAAHTIAVTEDGSAYSFGEGSNGQLGQGTHLLEIHSPRKLQLDAQIVYSDCGDNHSSLVSGTHLLQNHSPRKLQLDATIVYSDCGDNHSCLVSDKGRVYTFGDGRHGKLGLGNESFANQFKPCLVPRFRHLTVDKVTCGGCHMMVMAAPRHDSLHLSDDTYTQNDDKSINGDASSIDLNNSFSARDRRRQLVSPSASFNRTLPSLSSRTALPPLISSNPPVPSLTNHHLTPSLSANHKPLSFSSPAPLAQISHSEKTEDDRQELIEETFITQATLPRLESIPKPVPRMRKSPRPTEDEPTKLEQTTNEETKSDEETEIQEEHGAADEDKPEDEHTTKTLLNGSIEKPKVKKRVKGIFSRTKSLSEDENSISSDDNFNDGDNDNLDESISKKSKDGSTTEIKKTVMFNGIGDSNENNNNRLNDESEQSDSNSVIIKHDVVEGGLFGDKNVKTEKPKKAKRNKKNKKDKDDVENNSDNESFDDDNKTKNDKNKKVKNKKDKDVVDNSENDNKIKSKKNKKDKNKKEKDDTNDSEHDDKVITNKKDKKKSKKKTKDEIDEDEEDNKLSSKKKEKSKKSKETKEERETESEEESTDKKKESKKDQSSLSHTEEKEKDWVDEMTKDSTDDFTTETVPAKPKRSRLCTVL